MKPLFRIFAAVCLLAAASTSAAEAFEGKVTMTVSTGKGESHDINYSIKGHKCRIDMSGKGHQAATITDLEKMESIILMPEQQMYMVMPIKQPVEKAMAKANDTAAEVERTGKTDAILGHKCEQILVKDKERRTTTELWVAKDLGAFMGMGNGGGGGNPMGGMFGGRKAASPQAAKWEEILKDGGGFPMRVVTTDAGGKNSYKMEVTKIDSMSLPDSDFAPPAGYQKFQMPDFGGMNPFKRN
jgi:hypothetical protein